MQLVSLMLCLATTALAVWCHPANDIAAPIHPEAQPCSEGSNYCGWDLRNKLGKPNINIWQGLVNDSPLMLKWRLGRHWRSEWGILLRSSLRCTQNHALQSRLYRPSCSLSVKECTCSMLHRFRSVSCPAADTYPEEKDSWLTASCL